MSRTKRKYEVIGQGKYGCVHKPSLRCTKNPKNMTYKNKISKIMKKKYAEIELDEYAVMQKIDNKQRFYLGTPIQCSPKHTRETIQSLRKCDYLRASKINDYELLIMENGGNNLKMFANCVSSYVFQNSEDDTHNCASFPNGKKMNRIKKGKDIMKQFWNECNRLFIGLIVLQKNNIIHQDLKPQNIVYDVKKQRVNFIDFGLMTTIKEIKKLGLESKYNNNELHWSFPPEIVLINVTKFKNREQEFDNFITDIENPEGHINYFMEVTVPDYLKKRESVTIQQHIKDYHTMLFDELPRHSYDIFMTRIMETFDVYGLGISLIYVLNKTSKMIHNDMASELQSLFLQMVNFNVFRRIKPVEAHRKYEHILKKYNGFIGNRHSASFITSSKARKRREKRLKKTIRKLHINDSVATPEMRINDNYI